MLEQGRAEERERMRRRWQEAGEVRKARQRLPFLKSLLPYQVRDKL